MKNKQVVVIGSGFSSLAAACYLQQMGAQVRILEKNDYVGGRARQLKKDGFTFDMGPTFYWMPDVFEAFFNDFNKSASDYYSIEKLNPAYEVYFGKADSVKIPDNLADIYTAFEAVEKGSSKGLKKFMAKAERNYTIAIKDLVYQPGENLLEIVTPTTAKKLFEFIDTIKAQVGRHISNPKLQKILEFPVLFLGAKPENTPSFYNFMNWADFGLGTWQPKGGMYEVAQGMYKLALDLGVEFELNCAVEGFRIEGKKIQGVHAAKGDFSADFVVSGADYHHTEQLLPSNFRQYSETYWSKRTFAPSALLFYVGFKKKLRNVSHHTLFFDTDFGLHAQEIYTTKKWPTNPLFYASFPSITDAGFAPQGYEAGTFLIPLATGLTDSPEIRARYFDMILERMETLTEQTLKDEVVFQESFAVSDFVQDYNSYKGNAYGLANTLLQTHILRPNLRSRKLQNLYFGGQLTVPGPGVPPAIISGKIVAELLQKRQ